MIETHVLDHLDTFIGSVEDWLREKAAERSVEQQQREAASNRERAALTALDKRRALRVAEYDRMLDDGDPKAHLALESVDRIDKKREAQQQRIAEVEAVVAEWAGPPDVDAVLDYYNAIADVVTGQIAKADGARELGRALGSVLAGLWIEVECAEECVQEPAGEVEVGGVRLRFVKPEPTGRRVPTRLLVEFALRDPRPVTLPGGVAILPAFRRERESLPPASLVYLPLEPRPFEEVAQNAHEGGWATSSAKLSSEEGSSASR